ncbi:hypothetical protein [Azohydromonas aeria]|uniref:hypothetical protein n=1 Tax=Azohydromonas aeria TaxID=2590212 RepID=UPI0012FC7B2D|nr:hypothetical protein [Azohydromonas aeria]
MNLIRLPSHYLEPQRALPFDVFDARGRLLLSAGHGVDAATLSQLLRWEPHANVVQYRAWRAEVEGGAPRPDAPQELHLPTRRLSLAQEWTMLVMALESALREPQPDGAWLRALHSVRLRARHVAELAPDGSIGHFIHAGGMHTNHYSCHQALRCMLLAGACARALNWSEEQVQALEGAALTMNVAMRPLQDMLAQRDSGLSAGLRQQVAQHPREGARLLAAAGVADPLWLGSVLLHHDAAAGAQPLAALTPAQQAAQQAAQLLRRVDLFGAKLSRRGQRAPLSGLRAVREACLGPGGQPDAIGAVLLQAVGLYPPGSFVRLASGEVAMVLARGSRANTPRVGAFADAAGQALRAPQLRDTAQPEFAVKAALEPAAVPGRPDHERLLALLVPSRRP